MDSKNFMSKKKVIAFITSSGFVFAAMGVSLALAALTLNATSIVSDGALNITGAASSTLDLGAGSMFSILQTASTSQLYANSSTITTFRYTNASGTNESVSGYGLFPSLFFTSASGGNET